MNDTIRTRIAAVLAEAQETHNGISDLALADAVIPELEDDYIIVEPGTPLAQRIAQWQLSNWDGHWEGPPDE